MVRPGDPDGEGLSVRVADCAFDGKGRSCNPRLLWPRGCPTRRNERHHREDVGRVGVVARHCQAAVAGWQLGRARIVPSRSLRGAKEGAEAELSADVSDPCRVSAPKPPNWGHWRSCLAPVQRANNRDWNAKPHNLLSTTLVRGVSPVFGHSSHCFPPVSARLRLTSARPPLSKCGEHDDGVELSLALGRSLNLARDPASRDSWEPHP